MSLWDWASNKTIDFIKNENFISNNPFNDYAGHRQLKRNSSAFSVLEGTVLVTKYFIHHLGVYNKVFDLSRTYFMRGKSSMHRVFILKYNRNSVLCSFWKQAYHYLQHRLNICFGLDDISNNDQSYIKLVMLIYDLEIVLIFRIKHYYQK